jgi:hypothetical protein
MKLKFPLASFLFLRKKGKARIWYGDKIKAERSELFQTGHYLAVLNIHSSQKVMLVLRKYLKISNKILCFTI